MTALSPALYPFDGDCAKAGHDNKWQNMTINDNFLIIKLFNDKDSNFTLVNDSLIFKINV